MSNKIIFIFLVFGWFMPFQKGNTQNILTCEMKKYFFRNSVIELKDDNLNTIAKIYRKNRKEVIDCNDYQYIIKKSWNKSFVFYNSVNEDTIATLTRNRIRLKNEPDYYVRTGRFGFKIKEDNEILIKGSYNPDFRFYHIEIKTPIYHDNLINLLAGYYAIRKCKEISRQNNLNYTWLITN
ncbi:MAG: hypothetical protein JSV24_06965 [Bacteroidales bacterium]|nr:MAG: hypothetical protein JSV24_06965 [Bacteroidales bacterium]